MERFAAPPIRGCGVTAFWASDDRRFVVNQGDAVAVMRQLDSESIDLVLCDPPYFLSGGGTTNRGGKRVSVNKGKWDAPKTAMEQFSWNMTWLAEVRRILKPTGTVMVFGTLHSVHATGFTMQNLGYRLLNDICWEKPQPPPNLGCRTLTHSHESLLWTSLGPRAKHYFNYAELKSLNEDRQLKDIWHFNRPSKLELIYGKHPTQKPLALLRRCLLMSLPANGAVLDPFAGSGSTGVAAAMEQPDRNWSYIGIELEAEWNVVAKARITAARKIARAA